LLTNQPRRSGFPILNDYFLYYSLRAYL
jgi:hypothetical protein